MNDHTDPVPSDPGSQLTDAERIASQRHAAVVAQRLGGDWELVNGVSGTRVERSRRRSQIWGEIIWSGNGRLHLDLHNLTPELIEHLVDGLVDHARLHELGGAGRAKRPKRLTYLLALMVAGGYRVDKLDHEHEALFGTPLFKMDLGTAPGHTLLVPWLFERPGVIDKAIRVLEG